MIDSPRTAAAVTVPGIDGSGPGHWQTLLDADPAFLRIQPASWSHPERDDWIAALDRAVAVADRPVLVAHSLGTLAVAHWAARPDLPPVAGALLVAIPDPAGPAFPATAGSFREPPLTPLPFPSIVVASTNDPYDPAGAAAGFAEAWGSRFLDLGDVGHINTDAGYGEWPLATTLIDSLRRA
ncbi:alpha/beta hydrolase [Actinoplanes sp. NPDC048796]|uniref:RBBP9/YdeN family alpha/beta hydrolase n=1 Tax=Actinoplanes sp. NPDC048796 TaxID=3155640 RepID=UPI0033F2E5A5